MVEPKPAEPYSTCVDRTRPPRAQCPACVEPASRDGAVRARVREDPYVLQARQRLIEVAEDVVKVEIGHGR